MATEYVVFKQIDIDGPAVAWVIVEQVAAVSADAAVRETAIEQGAGTYAAAPARSWQPRTVKVEARASFAKDES